MMLLLGFVAGGVFGVLVMAVLRGVAMTNLEASRDRWKNVAIKSGNLSAVSECLHLDALEGVDP